LVMMVRVRRSLVLLALVAAVAAVAVLLVTRGRAAPVLQTPAADALHVRQNKLVYGPGRGRVVQLRGINRSGSEYECLSQRGRFFDSPHPSEPDSGPMIREMVNWDINVVRLPLNEGCWFGSGSNTDGPPYRAAIEGEVRALNAHHLFVILTLQWNGAGDHPAISPLPMADASHSLTFWRSVADTFKGDGWVLFDLFNEPHNISWHCWLDGCSVPAGPFSHYPFRAAGMQQLIDAVRSTGATQPLIVTGNDYGRDFSGIASNLPHDPDHSLIFGLHTYGSESPCVGACLKVVEKVARRFPVLATEFGEIDCGGSYIRPEMRAFDRAGIGYLAWAWDATSPGGWNCRTGPALITNYGGTPTPYGAAFRSHLWKLGEPLRP
jgi:endoglucanase